MLGGSEVATLQMVQALAEGGYDVTVVVYYEHDDRMMDRYREAGAKLLFLDEKREGLKGMIRLTQKLCAIFRRERPDVVHVQYFAPGMIPILAARLAGIKKVFATVHAAGNIGYNWKSKSMFRFSAALTSHFFCVAENTERFWFGKAGGGRHSTLHNGVDVDLFRQAEPMALDTLASASPVIGIVGRVVKLKGHDCLFRAAKRLLPNHPNLKLLVVGDGADKTWFSSLADQLGIADHIVWTGRVEPEELPRYYKAMDILAMPSHWEGFGLTAAEAMAAGIPVAASDVPGLREVVSDDGVLFPVNDDNALACALNTLWENHEKYALAGQKRVSEHFSLKQQQAAWQEAYNKFLH